MRTGLFGGTFNPIHNGHLMAAQRVLDHFFLDRLYLIPCRVPPHKCPAYLAPAEERVRIIRLALPADARYRLSDVEIQRSGPSYTIDTVDYFRTHIVSHGPLFLIMGMDAFLEIDTWKNQRRLLERVQPVVVTRPVDGRTQTVDDVSRLDNYIRSRLPGDYVYAGDQGCWQRADGSRIHLLPMPPVDISSSRIRQRLRTGKAIGDLVPPAVSDYIDQKELYR
jgi:nicotinate-nucleotide adenylyltransferase